MNHEVTITASGPCGSGKSALLGEIEIMLKALGIAVRYADEKRAQADKNMNHADWTSELEMYTPRVVLVEDMPWLYPTTPASAPSDGAADVEVWWKRVGCLRNPGAHTGEESARDDEIAELRAIIKAMSTNTGEE